MRRHAPFLVILVSSAFLGVTRGAEFADLKLLDSQFRLLCAVPVSSEREPSRAGS